MVLLLFFLAEEQEDACSFETAPSNLPAFDEMAGGVMRTWRELFLWPKVATIY